MRAIEVERMGGDCELFEDDSQGRLQFAISGSGGLSIYLVDKLYAYFPSHSFAAVREATPVGVDG